MNEVVQLWLFGGIGVCIASGTYFAFSLQSGQDKLAERVAKIETIMAFWMDTIGSKAAKILHGPHTPELDLLLEKYVKGSMHESDWDRLFALVEEVENDITKPKEERALAALVNACAHRALFLKMPTFHKHEDLIKRL